MPLLARDEQLIIFWATGYAKVHTISVLDLHLRNYDTESLRRDIGKVIQGASCMGSLN
jgi:ABC-type proline/glycine betaine transport system ATPase subunit